MIELNDVERSLAEHISHERRERIDIVEVKKLVAAYIDNPNNLENFYRIEHLDTLEYIASLLAYSRIFGEDVHLVGIMKMGSQGVDIIKKKDLLWICQPTIEKILEADEAQLSGLASLSNEYIHSNQFQSLSQYRNDLSRLSSRILTIDDIDELIICSIELYRTCVQIFEIEFPYLLAVKRIFDGTNPSYEELCNYRFSKIIDELTDTTTHQNSVYFDLLVNQYDKHLRNCLVHGDYYQDISTKKVVIQSKNRSYSYDQFLDIVDRNVVVAVFSMDVLRSIITFKVYNDEPMIRSLILGEDI